MERIRRNWADGNEMSEDGAKFEIGAATETTFRSNSKGKIVGKQPTITSITSTASIADEWRIPEEEAAAVEEEEEEEEEERGGFNPKRWSFHPSCCI